MFNLLHKCVNPRENLTNAKNLSIFRLPLTKPKRRSNRSSKNNKESERNYSNTKWRKRQQGSLTGSLRFNLRRPSLKGHHLCLKCWSPKNRLWSKNWNKHRIMKRKRSYNWWKLYWKYRIETKTLMRGPLSATAWAAAGIQLLVMASTLRKGISKQTLIKRQLLIPQRTNTSTLQTSTRHFNSKVQKNDNI